MENLISALTMIIGMIGIIYVVSYALPEMAHAYYISLILFMVCGIWFAIESYNSIGTDDYNLSSLLGFLFCGTLVVMGGKNVAFKTVITVFSNLTNKPIGQMNTGAFNWSCPFTTKVSIDDTGHKAADLQSLEITIPQIGPVQTQTRGIRATFHKLSFMLKLVPERLNEIYEIEGGLETMRKKIDDFIFKFFEKIAKQKNPEFLDINSYGADPVEWITELLVKEIDKFCNNNSYPYLISLSKDGGSQITLRSIELDAAYYEALGKKRYAELDADANDLKATRLTERIQHTGQGILPNGSEKDQAKEAKIALGITPQTFQQNDFGISSDSKEILKEVLTIFLDKK